MLGWVAAAVAVLLVGGVLTAYAAYRDVFGKIHRVKVTGLGNRPRRYDNALVLYKPLSYANGQTGTLDGATATFFALDGTYRPLKADGSLGAPVTGVWLRNGEGDILVKVSDATGGTGTPAPTGGTSGGWFKRLLG